jgi:hypothetical protein
MVITPVSRLILPGRQSPEPFLVKAAGNIGPAFVPHPLNPALTRAKNSIISLHFSKKNQGSHFS